MTMQPYYRDELVTLYHGDARTIVPALYGDLPWGACECVVVDPPWDDPALMTWVKETVAAEYESMLVFTDPRRIGEPLTIFGPPAWVFTWDTMNTWSMSPRQPVQQSRFALWYGEHYDRDAQLWGAAPPARNHPTTKQTPLAGRRLTDCYRQSLRWLHNPSAGTGSAGTERFTQRQGLAAYRHAKPVDWLRCLIGNTSTGAVIDPFAGSGAALVAAKAIGRPAIGVELDEACCDVIARRLSHGEPQREPEPDQPPDQFGMFGDAA